MADLKLGKLPDRTPVKYTITVPPALNKRLLAYTAMYNETHRNGDDGEELEELIPYILGAFLDSDKAFARRMKQERRQPETEAPSVRPPSQSRRRPQGDAPQSVS